MAVDTWNNAVSGDWSDAADWSNDTVPASLDEAEFLVAGNYTVTVTSAATANALLFDAPGAELVESSASALDLNEFNLVDGSVELDGTNTTALTEIDAGVLTLGAPGALDGGGDLTISGGELLSTVSETLSNPLSMSGGLTIAAAPGTTLNLDGSAAWSLAGSIAGAIALDVTGTKEAILTQTCADTFTAGATIANGGTLQFGAGGIWRRADMRTKLSATSKSLIGSKKRTVGTAFGGATPSE